MKNKTDRRGRHALACAALCALYAILTWPIIWIGAVGPPAAFDQFYYHLPVIQTMAAEFPHVDLVNYRAATTPGYHMLMAVVTRFLTSDLFALQLMSNLFGMGMLIAAYATVARHCSAAVSSLVTLPLTCSMFTIMCGIWLATDNASWMFVALSVGGAALVQPTFARLIRWSLYATLALLVRQIHLWAMAPISVAAVLVSPLGDFAPSVLHGGSSSSPTARIGGVASLAVLPAILLPFVVISMCVWAWYGLTPLGFQEPHEGNFSMAAPSVTLALVGLFGMFYLPIYAGSVAALGALMERHWRWPMACALIAIAMPTTYDLDAGRWGGSIWTIARLSPTIAHSSTGIVMLAALGGLVLAAAWRAAANSERRRDAVIIFVALAAFTAAQSFNSLCFQRYFEPMILLSLNWLAIPVLGQGLTSGPQPHSRWWVGIAGLTTLQLMLTILGVYARLEMPAAGTPG